MSLKTLALLGWILLGMALIAFGTALQAIQGRQTFWGLLAALGVMIQIGAVVITGESIEEQNQP